MSNNMESEQNMIEDLCKRLAKAQEAADESGMIIDVETEDEGYKVYTKVLEAKDYGTPQLRKRLFFVGIRKDIDVEFTFPEPVPLKYTFSEIMGGKTERDYSFTIRIGGRRSGINNRFNWDAYRVDGEVRYITPEECLLLHGFLLHC